MSLLLVDRNIMKLLSVWVFKSEWRCSGRGYNARDKTGIGAGSSVNARDKAGVYTGSSVNARDEAGSGVNGYGVLGVLCGMSVLCGILLFTCMYISSVVKVIATHV